MKIISNDFSFFVHFGLLYPAMFLFNFTHTRGARKVFLTSDLLLRTLWLII